MVNRELSDFEHEGVHRTLQWDLRQATRVIDASPTTSKTLERRHVVEEVRRVEGARIAGLAPRLPVSVIHGDITDDNVVRSGDEHGTPDGVIDFGDLNTGWSVADLAVTVSSILHHEGATPASTLPAIRAFHRERPLTGDEVQALWPLVLLRGAVLVVSGWQQAAIDADNEYAREAREHEWRILENALTVPDDGDDRARAARGRRVRSPLALPASFRPMVDERVRVARLDLSPDSDAMDEGAWLDRWLRSRAGTRPSSPAGADVVCTVHLQPRLTRSTRLSRESPPPPRPESTCGSGATPKCARRGPAGCRSMAVEISLIRRRLADRRRAPRLRLNAEAADVVGVGHLRRGRSPAEGEGRSPSADHRRGVGCRRARLRAGIRAQRLARRRRRPAPVAFRHDDARRECRPDARPMPPNSCISASSTSRPCRSTTTGIHPASNADGSNLIDVDARCYLDMVNNVAALGHAHPGVNARPPDSCGGSTPTRGSTTARSSNSLPG